MPKEWSLSREGSLSGGFSVQGVSLLTGCICPGGLCTGGSLSSRVSVRETPSNYEQTDACENITLPQTSFAGGKYD